MEEEIMEGDRINNGQQRRYEKQTTAKGKMEYYDKEGKNSER